MQRISVTTAALLGGLASLPVIALSYLGEQLAGLPFIPFDLFDWLARVLPGDVVTLGIDSLVKIVRTLNLGPTSDTAKLLEQLTAIGLVMVGGAVVGATIAWIQRGTTAAGWRIGVLAGFVLFVFITAVELDLGLEDNAGLAVAWLAVLSLGWGTLVGWMVDVLLGVEATPGAAQAERRAVLVKIAGGSIGVVLGAWGLGRFVRREQPSTGAAQPLAKVRTTPESGITPTPAGPSMPSATTPPTTPMTATATLRERVPAAPGTRSEVTPNEDFYRIDINTRPVAINEDEWLFRVKGLFDNPREFTLTELINNYSPVTQPITLCCISNPVGGDLIGTSYWTGLRLRDLVKDRGLQPEATHLFVVAKDNFYESVPLEDVMDPRTLLVYGMNDETLPVEHGFPLRIYIPNRYGMKQPKWIVSIEAVDGSRSGYWVDRGWSKEARPHIVSIIDTVAADQVVDGTVPVGGIAWAGDRGIQKVELQVDDGEWRAAVLRTPPLSHLTWVQWRYDWPAEPGRHTLRVRATDGTGALQTEDRSPSAPDGATGYHQVEQVVDYTEEGVS